MRWCERFERRWTRSRAPTELRPSSPAARTGCSSRDGSSKVHARPSSGHGALEPGDDGAPADPVPQVEPRSVSARCRASASGARRSGCPRPRPAPRPSASPGPRRPAGGRAPRTQAMARGLGVVDRRLIREYSICRSTMGWTARTVSAPTSDRPTWRTCPLFTRSVIAPTVSSIGTFGSTRAIVDWGDLALVDGGVARHGVGQDHRNRSSSCRNASATLGTQPIPIGTKLARSGTHPRRAARPSRGFGCRRKSTLRTTLSDTRTADLTAAPPGTLGALRVRAGSTPDRLARNGALA